MFKFPPRFLIFFLLLKVVIADSENGSENSPNPENTSSYSSFPSISSISSSDGSFSIPQPSLDLAPTDLAENSPMSFSIPSLELNLEEPDFSRTAPMSFSITKPAFDLEQSFTFGQYSEEAPESKEDVGEVETSSNDKVPTETQTYQEGEKDENLRRRRQAPDFPSIFSFRSSNDPFSIAFPSPDLTPGTSLFKFQDPVHGGRSKKIRQTKFHTKDPLINEISDASHDKRQVSFFNFRPSKLLSQSNLKPSKPVRPIRHKTRRPASQGSKFGSLDPVLLLPQPEDVARPVRQNRFRPPPRYPPFDPFNTTYIPLPGPSSPRFALPLSGGNPHMVSGAEGTLFRRPIRQSLHSPVLPATKGLRSQFSGPDPEHNVFKYKSSSQFEASELGRFFRSKNRSVPK